VGSVWRGINCVSMGKSIRSQSREEEEEEVLRRGRSETDMHAETLLPKNCYMRTQLCIQGLCSF